MRLFLINLVFRTEVSLELISIIYQYKEKSFLCVVEYVDDNYFDEDLDNCSNLDLQIKLESYLRTSTEKYEIFIEELIPKELERVSDDINETTLPDINDVGSVLSSESSWYGGDNVIYYVYLRKVFPNQKQMKLPNIISLFLYYV